MGFPHLPLRRRNIASHHPRAACYTTFCRRRAAVSLGRAINSGNRKLGLAFDFRIYRKNLPRISAVASILYGNRMSRRNLNERVFSAYRNPDARIDPRGKSAL